MQLSYLVPPLPPCPSSVLSSEALPHPVEEQTLPSAAMKDQLPFPIPPCGDQLPFPIPPSGDQLPFPIPPSGSRMGPGMSRTSSLHPQILKMLGLPPELSRDATSSGDVSETGVFGCGVCRCGKTVALGC